MSEDAAGGRGRSRPGTWALLALILALTAGLRLRFLDLPLNRDEGEYAYVAQLLLQGLPPYSAAYSMRLPGIYAAYAAVLKLFGESHTAVHLGLLLVNVATVAVVFVLGRRLFDSPTGLVAAAAYSALSINGYFLGFAAYSEHFVLLPALLGLLLVLQALERRRIALAGLGGVLLAAAVLIKQPGIFFLIFGLGWLVWQGRSTLRSSGPLVLSFVAGAVIPVALTLLALAASGVFARFWFWTVSYAGEYVSERPLDTIPRALAETLGPLARSAWLLLALTLLGASAPLWDARARARAAFLGGFGLASVAATATGLYFRPHYWLLLLPVAALLVGLAVTTLARRVPGVPGAVTAIVVTLAATGLALASQRAFLFELPPVLLARAAYHGNPYPEALEVARYLKANTSAAERVVVIGSEPEIYFYAGRRAGTGYLYMYPLMERHQYARMMQEEMIREVEAADPSYLVVVWVNYSWMVGPDSDTRLFTWLERYRQRFARVGVIDIVAYNHTEYRWGAEAAGYTPRARYWLEILRRKPGV